MNVAQTIALQGRYRPGEPAIEIDSRIITYGEFELMVRRVAARLAGAGIRPGDLIGLRLYDTPEYLAAVLGVAWLGATVLPMDWRTTPAEAGRMVRRFSARAVIADEDLLVDADVALLNLTGIEAEPPVEGAPAVPQAPFIYSPSSGTTGEPKAAVLSHEATLARLSNVLIATAVRPRDRILACNPLSSGLGRTPLLAHLALGATVVFFPTIFEARELIEVVAKRRIDTLSLVPTTARALLHLPPAASGPLLPGLRRIVSGGAGLHPEERAQIRARLCPRLLDTYASHGVNFISVSDNQDQDAAPTSVGRPIMGVEIEIVGDDGRVLPPGEIGWLRARGAAAAATIIGAVAGSDERIEDGWVYPGDLARFDQAGYLYLEGRSSEIIKRAGITVRAGEIERVLALHPAVVEAAVVGAPDAEMGETVVAFVVIKAPVEPRALIVHCRRQLAPYKVPRRVIIIEALPRNTNGKVVKRRLLERLD